ncbi:BA14K-like protein [Rhizobium sp. NFR07]|uniref:BA14K family protein n=1 Tax=Rhizobium sp. NFR07 TaxID=1566262 RepID=UPI0008EFBF0B|nr:BA14K family protein [Rhizobium sp. NFR07]SFB50409.1 BA14K-like protein [Rhizobium sp. NFR07]
MKKLAIILVSAITALSGVAPAQALPTVGIPKVQTSQPVENVQYRGDMWRNGGRPGPYWRHGGRHHRYYRDGYRGRHYGRYYRHRHHHGNNAGAIIGGLAAGAIIGGALAQPRYAPPPRRYVGASGHTEWCYNRYRSYRAYDNTFQPYNGPRQQCYSPYR